MEQYRVIGDSVRWSFLVLERSESEEKLSVVMQAGREVFLTATKRHISLATEQLLPQAGKMNRAQKIVLAVGFGLFLISLCFMPWRYESKSDPLFSDSGRLPFWQIYDQAYGPHIPGVLLDWAIIAALTGGAFVLVKATSSK